VIVLHFNLDSPWGAFSADHLVPVGATGPEKAVERLIDEVGGNSHSWMSLVEKCNDTETATIAWNGYLSGDKISGENLDHSEAECNEVVFGGITCEGEWVEVENQDEIIAALNKAFVSSDSPLEAPRSSRSLDVMRASGSMSLAHENAEEAAEENHDPAEFGGREWDQLESWERRELIDEQVSDTFASAVDMANTLRKEGE